MVFFHAEDLRIWKNLTDWSFHGQVHEGFYTEWLSLRGCVRRALRAVGAGRLKARFGEEIDENI